MAKIRFKSNNTDSYGNFIYFDLIIEFKTSKESFEVTIEESGIYELNPDHKNTEVRKALNPNLKKSLLDNYKKIIFEIYTDILNNSNITNITDITK